MGITVLKVRDFGSVEARDYGVPLDRVAPLVAAADMRHEVDRLTALTADVAANGIREPLTILAPRPSHPGECPCLVNGHHRAAVAIALGLIEVPVAIHEPVESKHYPGVYTYPTW
jgi:hypothetical protein